MTHLNIGNIFVDLQPDADKQRTKPFPLGAGHDKFGLGFQLAAPTFEPMLGVVLWCENVLRQSFERGRR